MAEMSEGKAGRLGFAVCAVAEKHETNMTSKRDAVLFIACPRDSDFGPAKRLGEIFIRWLVGKFLQRGRACPSKIPDYIFLQGLVAATLARR